MIVTKRAADHRATPAAHQAIRFIVPGDATTDDTAFPGEKSEAAVALNGAVAHGTIWADAHPDVLVSGNAQPFVMGIGGQTAIHPRQAPADKVAVDNSHVRDPVIHGHSTERISQSE